MSNQPLTSDNSGKSQSSNHVFRSIIPPHIANNAQLNSFEKMTYCMIDSLSGSNGCCWHSQEELAQKVGCSLRTIRRCIERLVDLCLLKTEQVVHGHTLRYYPQRPTSSTKVCSQQTLAQSARASQSATQSLGHRDLPLGHSDRQIIKDIKKEFLPLPPHAAGEKRLLISSTPSVTTHKPVRYANAVCGVGGDPLKNFEKLWNAYPKKEAYGLAKSAFFRMRRSLPSCETMLDCISFKMREVWAGKETRYIPSLEYFLKGERWLDSDFVEYQSAPKVAPAPIPTPPILSMKAPERTETPEEKRGASAFISAISRSLTPNEKGVISAFWRNLNRKGVTLTEEDGARFGGGAIFSELHKLSSLRAAV